MARLKVIEEEDNERQRRKKMAEIESQTEFERMWRLKYAELYADQLVIANDEDPFLADDFGLTKDELHEEVMNMFGDAPPLPFSPRKGQQLHEQIASAVDQFDVKIPIVWIDSNTYLIGTQKLKFEYKNNCLLVNVGAGYESFSEYIKNNEQQI